MTCIGYAGYEAFDVILYISRTLTKLNYRVMIIDFSETEALTCAINHGMGLDSKSDIINYRDINYVRRMPADDELEMFKDGVVFVVYGFNIKDNMYPVSKINIVTTPYIHVINRVKQLINEISEVKSENIGLLIKDIISPDDVDRVKTALDLPEDEENVDYLYLDMNDIENAINCQQSKIVRFTNISSAMKNYIISQIKSINPKLKKSQIKQAMARARRGD